MTVSVIIPSYNAMKFLPETLQSALNQTYSDLQIIVVDDGSTDSIAEFIAQQSDRRIVYVKKLNGGLSSARNAGIKKASGEYIALLDADDLWEPDKIERQVSAFQSNPSTGLNHTAIRYINEHGTEVNRVLGVEGEGDVKGIVSIQNPVRCGSSPMIRSECFANVGLFDETITFSEDWEMWIRISRRYQFSIINDPLTLYRQHPFNMTKSYQLILPNLLRIIDRAFEDEPTFANREEAVGRAYLFAAWRAYYAGDIRFAHEAQLKAWRHHPKLLLLKNNAALTLRLLRSSLG